MGRAFDRELFDRLTGGRDDFLLQVLDDYPQGVSIIDAQGWIVYFNRAQLEIEELRAGDVLGRHLLEVYQGLLPSGSLLLRGLTERRPVLGKWVVYNNPKGRQIPAQVHAFPLFRGEVLTGCLAFTRPYPQALDYQELAKLIRPPFEAAETTLDGLVGEAPEFLAAVALARKAAACELPVLIHGETGSGKELFARGIHKASARREGPFVAVNCAAVPESLFEGLMFGVSRGAFTGATDRAGFFEEAQGGTIYLDELDSMPPAVQPKVLRVLQDRVARRLGAGREKKLDFRLISSLGSSPAQALERGGLRRDVFYRLSALQIGLPPLRDRPGDIAKLVEYFLLKHAKGIGKALKRPSLELLELFKAYSWPGNVRELEHVVMGGAVMAGPRRQTLGLDLLPEHFKSSFFMRQKPRTGDRVGPAAILADKEALAGPRKPEPLEARWADEPLEARWADETKEREREAIARRLSASYGNVALAARLMGLAPQTLHYKIKRLGLDPKRFKLSGLAEGALPPEDPQ